MGDRAASHRRQPGFLDPEEAELYRDLLDGTLGLSIRLEQERTSFAAIEQAVAR
jgi:hypothetical protein